tara:strand:- start:650 stop:892 length:243 start_codon:yes stop_codon:yes gene_type:complete
VKRFLIPLLAVIALPSAVNAETWWMMAAGRTMGVNPFSTWTVPFSSEADCEAAGKIFMDKKWDESVLHNKAKDYLCVRGK